MEEQKDNCEVRIETVVLNKLINEIRVYWSYRGITLCYVSITTQTEGSETIFKFEHYHTLTETVDNKQQYIVWRTDKMLSMEAPRNEENVVHLVDDVFMAFSIEITTEERKLIEKLMIKMAKYNLDSSTV